MDSQQTLRERIADMLREAIVRGELKAGTRLQEVEIATQYHTSRTPVRESLRQLESEGFLVIKPRRGAVVAPITAKDVREFYELKSILEAYAARRAVDLLTDNQIDQMERLNNELEECYSRSDVSRMVPVHNAFHEIFVEACGNERLSSMIKSLVKQFQRFRIALSHTDGVAESIRLHREIIQAFRERDRERVAQLVAENSSQGGEMLVSRLSL